MGILTGIWKPNRRKKELQEADFPIDDWITRRKPFVLYLGNGADGICYARKFKEHGIRGQELLFEKESGSCRAVQELEEGGGPVPVVNGFTHTTAEFVGFTVRKKEDGRWLWYIKGEGFRPLSADMGERQLFSEGDDIGMLLGADGGFLVLQAQWQHPVTGVHMGNGYPMFSNQLLAHAFGALDGHVYSNTPAAYENAVRSGYRYFEVDLSYTTDGRLVCCHGWSKNNCKSMGIAYSKAYQKMTYRRAMKLKLHGHKLMDARQFYRRMKRRPQDTFQIDFHEVYGEDLRNRVNALLRDFSYDGKALDRLIIQAYSMQMFREIDAVYHFKHYQYLVGDKACNLDAILSFCLDHDICAVAMRGNLTTPEMIQKIKNAGMYAMCYTVKRDADFAKYLLDMGADTVCTDYVTQNELKEAKESFGRYPFFAAYIGGDGQAAEETEVLSYRNDGTERLNKNSFEKEGCVFAGWQMRVVIDGTKLWYGDDGLFHVNQDFKGKTGVAVYLFAEGERLPVFTVKEGMTAEFIAAWKDISFV